MEQLLARVARSARTGGWSPPSRASSARRRGSAWRAARSRRSWWRLGRFLQRAERRRARLHRLADLPLETLLQEQTSADSGSMSTPMPLLAAASARTAGSDPPDAPAAAAVQRELQQRAVVGGVAHQDRAEQLLAILRDDQLLVDPDARRCRRSSARPASLPCASPIEATSTPISLSLVLMSAPRNCTLVSPTSGAPRPPPSGSPARPGRRCALPTARIRRWRRCPGCVVWQCESMRMPPRSPTASPAARASSSRGRMPAENTIMSVSRLVPSANTSGSAVPSRRRSPSCSSQMDRRAQRLDLPAQQPPGRIVELHRHQARRELDDVRLQARGPSAPSPPPGRAGRRRSPRRPSSAPRRGGDHLEVLDRAVDEAVAPVAAGDRRHERIRAGGEHQLVVRHLLVARRAHDLLQRVDRRARRRSGAASCPVFSKNLVGTRLRSTAVLPEKKLVSCTRS